MQHHQSGSPIASAVAKCLESFTTIEKTIVEDHPELQTALIDCRGQFRIWAGNIGAHQTGTSSLDHRLRDVPYVSRSALQLLSALDGLIADAWLLLAGRRQSSDHLTHDSDSSDNDSSENEDAYGPSELKQIFLDISELIASLFRLSMSIRNPTVTRRYNKASSLDTSAFESYDVEHVRQKFPGAPAYLAYRLGKANSRRRQWLKYRDIHAQKLARDLDGDDVSAALSDTTASTFKRESIFESNGGGDMYESSISMSETSYATSAGAFSKSQMLSMPKEARNEQPFECPYCHGIERVKHTHAWKKHVFNDLRPYICTFEDCTSATETYESRHAWFNHELQNHHRTWTCNRHCTMTFTTEEAMRIHIHDYGLVMADSQTLLPADMCINPINEAVTSKCVICDRNITGISKFRKHLGGHLEELALFPLPTTNAESDAEDDSTSSDNEVDENTEVMRLEEYDKHGHGINMLEINDHLISSEHSPSATKTIAVEANDKGGLSYQRERSADRTRERSADIIIERSTNRRSLYHRQRSMDRTRERSEDRTLIYRRERSPNRRSWRGISMDRTGGRSADRILPYQRERSTNRRTLYRRENSVDRTRGRSADRILSYQRERSTNRRPLYQRENSVDRTIERNADRMREKTVWTEREREAQTEREREVQTEREYREKERRERTKIREREVEKERQKRQKKEERMRIREREEEKERELEQERHAEEETRMRKRETAREREYRERTRTRETEVEREERESARNQSDKRYL